MVAVYQISKKNSIMFLYTNKEHMDTKIKSTIQFYNYSK